MLSHTAQHLARKGLAVFPCLVGQKEPATANGFYAATTDATTIACWWRQQPNYNIGVAMGHASGIFLIDIDNHGSGDGEAELKKLEDEHGELPATVEAISGSGGRHLFFQMPAGDLRSCKLAPGLDVKANGGYALMAPSVHPCGRRYEWSVDTAKTFAAAPDWLLAKIAPANSNGRAVTPAAEWRDLAKGVAEGARDCTASRLAGHLLRRRVDPFVVLELLQGWNTRCTPPLPESDIERIVDSIAGRELKRRGL
jgi:hypothetical protein